MRISATLAALFAASAYAAPSHIVSRGTFSDGSERIGNGIEYYADNAANMIEKGGQSLSNAVNTMGQNADKTVASAQQMGQEASDDVKNMINTVSTDIQKTGQAAGHLAKGASNLGKTISNGISSCALGDDPNCN
ncbi:hypothetical protein PWT90_08406 [Aphanocladium album]|nr:hypothetical protein PWT90_08406 [Aphanocladium album]